MRRYIIERDIPNVGALTTEGLADATRKSNSVLNQLGTGVQWIESYVTKDKIYCVYVTNDERLIREHAELSGFPATEVNAVNAVIDPTTAS
jgi:hypothetical protein